MGDTKGLGSQAVAWVAAMLGDPATAANCPVTRSQGTAANGPDPAVTYECQIGEWTVVIARTPMVAASGYVSHYSGGSIRTSYEPRWTLEVADAGGDSICRTASTDESSSLCQLFQQVRSLHTQRAAPARERLAAQIQRDLPAAPSRELD